MINLKYSEILQLNKQLSKTIKGVPYKITILSNVILNSLNEILEYSLRSNEINPEITIGNYDNILQDSNSVENEDLVLIFYDALNIVEKNSIYFEFLDGASYEDIKTRICLELEMIMFNLKNIPEVVFNKFSAANFDSSHYYSAKIEILVNELNEYIESKKGINITVLNIDKIIFQVGRERAFDLRLFHSSKAPYTLLFLKYYVSALEHVILKNRGKLRKAIIFDCDNTLWKGIIGEDGLDNIDMSASSLHGKPYQTVQQIAKYLSKNGVIIGLCSKNNDNDVMDAISNHPDMVLKEDYIIIRKINWNDKVSNLKAIARELNIGLDSLVFIDDSSFEINLVNKHLPEIITLKVPPLIYEYPSRLLMLAYKYFSLTQNSEDEFKTAIYKQQLLRDQTKEKFENIEDYLSSINIILTISKDPIEFIPRIAQITQKTNQFNLTTRRYTENQITNFITNENIHVFTVSVKDDFGDNGLTSVCIIKNENEKFTIDTFLLSCRIIGRNIELAFMNYLFNWLRNMGVIVVYAEYVPTKKNSQVEQFYDKIGFNLLKKNDQSKYYSINIQNYKAKQSEYIQIENSHDIRNIIPK